jgi:hypothetical protein
MGANPYQNTKNSRAIAPKLSPESSKRSKVSLLLRGRGSDTNNSGKRLILNPPLVCNTSRGLNSAICSVIEHDLVVFDTMPPNLLPQDVASTSRFGRRHQCDHEKDDDDDDAEICVGYRIEPGALFTRYNEADEHAKFSTLWQEWLANRKTVSSRISEDHDLSIDALSSIVLMDNEVDQAKWLDRFEGRLSNISKDLLAALR